MQFVALPTLQLLHQRGQPFLKLLRATPKPNTEKLFIGFSIDVPRQEKETLLFCQVTTKRFCWEGELDKSRIPGLRWNPVQNSLAIRYGIC